MNYRIVISSSVVCCAFLAAAALAQNKPPEAPPGTPDFTTMPEERGIYYKGVVGWKPLQFTVLTPFFQGGVANFFNLAPAHAIEEMPGPHAYIQLSETRPTFYLRGISTNELYLVRVASKGDYREVKMPLSRNFAEWAHFSSKDVTPIDVQAVAADVIAVRPAADLRAGEYTLAAVASPGDYWVRLGYDFGVTPAGAAK